MTPDQTATVLSAERVLEAVLQTMQAARYCFFITSDASGQPQARLVFAYGLGQDPALTDLAERRRWWDEDLRPFFPRGPEADDFLLIEFRPQRVEVMSFSHRVASEPDSWAPATLEWAGGRWILRERAGRG